MTVLPMSTEYDKAVQIWNEGKASLFEFCVEASHIVGNYDEGKTIELAERIMRSVSQTQNYAKVGKLWEALISAYPSQAELLREDLHPSHWLPVSRLWVGELITLEGALQWLILCRKNKWTVEKFRNQLPTVDKEFQSEYARTVKQLEFKTQSLMATIEEAMTAPAFGVDEKEYKKFHRALKLVKGRAPKVMRKEQ